MERADMNCPLSTARGIIGKLEFKLEILEGLGEQGEEYILSFASTLITRLAYFGEVVIYFLSKLESQRP